MQKESCANDYLLRLNETLFQKYRVTPGVLARVAEGPGLPGAVIRSRTFCLELIRSKNKLRPTPLLLPLPRHTRPIYSNRLVNFPMCRYAISIRFYFQGFPYFWIVNSIFCYFY